jgi:hypothetical protein
VQNAALHYPLAAQMLARANSKLLAKLDITVMVARGRASDMPPETWAFDAIEWQRLKLACSPL